jgi:allophanate hydrolase subunit 1
VELNARSIALADHLDADPFPGYIESVPCYASTAVFYDVHRVKHEFPNAPTAFDQVRTRIESLLNSLNINAHVDSRLIEIPLSFDEHVAPDLPFIAESATLISQRSYRYFYIDDLSRVHARFPAGLTIWARLTRASRFPKRNPE